MSRRGFARAAGAACGRECATSRPQPTTSSERERRVPCVGARGQSPPAGGTGGALRAGSRRDVLGNAPARRSGLCCGFLMPDLLDRIRTELNAPIRELRPVVREFERLVRAAGAIARAGARSVPGLRSRVGPAPAGRDAAAGARGKRGARPAAAGPATRRSSPARRGGAPRRKVAPRGQTRAKVLEALAAAPGSGPAAVAKASGVSASVAAATLSRLVKQGRVQRLERGGYAIVDAAAGRRSDGAPASAAGAAEQTAAGQATQAPPPPRAD